MKTKVIERLTILLIIYRYIKKFSILIGWEQYSFEDIQCRKEEIHYNFLLFLWNFLWNLHKNNFWLGKSFLFIFSFCIFFMLFYKTAWLERYSLHFFADATLSVPHRAIWKHCLTTVGIEPLWPLVYRKWTWVKYHHNGIFTHFSRSWKNFVLVSFSKTSNSARASDSSVDSCIQKLTRVLCFFFANCTQNQLKQLKL